MTLDCPGPRLLRDALIAMIPPGGFTKVVFADTAVCSTMLVRLTSGRNDRLERVLTDLASLGGSVLDGNETAFDVVAAHRHQDGAVTLHVRARACGSQVAVRAIGHDTELGVVASMLPAAEPVAAEPSFATH